MAFQIRRKGVRNSYVGDGEQPVSRMDATLYPTRASAEAAVARAAQRLGVEQADLLVQSQQTSGEHKKDDPLDAYIALDIYIEDVQPYIESGQFDRDEVEYKIEIVERLEQAREAVIANNSEWPSVVKRSLANNNLIGGTWRAADVITDWAAAEPSTARMALMALWSDDGPPVGERIRAFLAQVPEDRNFRGIGSRLRIVAVLLMALGRDHPPFKITEFKKAYTATGHPPAPRDGDEGTVYEHALAFLDTILERTRTLGYDRPADRLEAQSLVWMQGWIGDPPTLPHTPTLWQVRAGTDAESAPTFLELGRIDIGFRWHSDVGAVDSREEFNRLLTAEGRSADTSAHPRSPGTQLWSFAHEMQAGDLVLVPLPDQQVHIGEITGPYWFDENPDGHSHFRYIDWLAQNVPHERIGEAATDTFVRWTVQQIDDPAALEHVRAFLENPDGDPAPLSLDTLADDLLYDVSFLRNIVRLLEEKKQVIFQGPPGTGKTYVARRLARALAGADERVRLVQFHPSYAYEDFVQGYRPTLDEEGRAGFELRDGPLVEMAERAREEPDKAHFLVIDEINRGNLAKVFGELYFLLEYRDSPMRLQYAKEDDDDFSLPDNLYIIGTMNTADRSIALVDLALRRRFSFVEFHPEKEPIKRLLGRWLDENAPDMPWLAEAVELANGKLDNREAAIGPSYFMKDDLDEERVARIWEHDVLPYVEEQLYGQHDRLAEFGLEALRRELGGGGEADGATGDEQEDEDGSGDADA